VRANNVLGIIYSNGYDDCLRELTALRSMGTVPIGGRYRLIDFPLSNMVNCGISRVGVITKGNFSSLMNHVGSGREWDLSRGRDGLFILPPFNRSDTLKADSRMSSLISIKEFLASCRQEYVLMSDCNVLCSLNYEKVFEFHKAKNADVSLCYARGKMPALPNLFTFDAEDGGRIQSAALSPETDDDVNYSLNIFVMRKALLERLLNEAQSHNYSSFERDILLGGGLNIRAFEVKGFRRTVDSLRSYYEISMELLNAGSREALFMPERPVFTKVYDDAPVIYGLDSEVKNSLITDGCHIEGRVENSVLFRGVKVGRGAVVRNSVLMQGAYIGDECEVDHVIMDKNVTIKPHKSLNGDKAYPFFVGKGLVI